MATTDYSLERGLPASIEAERLCGGVAPFCATKMGVLITPPNQTMKNKQPNRNTPTQKSEDFVLMDNGQRFYLWVIGIPPSSRVVSNGESSTPKH